MKYVGVLVKHGPAAIAVDHAGRGVHVEVHAVIAALRVYVAAVNGVIECTE